MLLFTLLPHCSTVLLVNLVLEEPPPGPGSRYRLCPPVCPRQRLPSPAANELTARCFPRTEASGPGPEAADSGIGGSTYRYRILVPHPPGGGTGLDRTEPRFVSVVAGR